jgi:Flp pilus assembly pilin Flp
MGRLTTQRMGRLRDGAFTSTRRLLRDERGLSSMEYSVLLVVIVVLGLVVWKGLGSELRSKVTGGEEVVSTALNEATTDPESNSANG